MARSSGYGLVMAILFAMTTGQVDGVEITGPTDANHVGSLTIPPDGDVVKLNPDPLEQRPTSYLLIPSSSSDMQHLLTTDYPNWNFTFHDGGLDGSLNIDSYTLRG